MPNYKAPDNSLHVIEPEFAHLLPAGSVPITDEEAEALRPTPPAPSVLDEIRALEAANPITHRHLRDLSRAVAQIAEAITGQPAATLPMVQEITALEVKIAALRAQL